MAGLEKFAVKTEPGRVLLVEWDQIFYIEAENHDTLVRMARKKVLRHVEELHEVEARLASPPFFRIHRSYLVNLDRVYEVRERRDGEHEVKMDPPVNKVLPLSRRRYAQLRKLLRI